MILKRTMHDRVLPVSVHGAEFRGMSGLDCGGTTLPRAGLQMGVILPVGDSLGRVNCTYYKQPVMTP